MATVMLTPYGVPELAAQATAALQTFIQGNKKLTITAEPVNGLAVTELMALSSAAQTGRITPAEIAERLNISISAQ